MKKYGLPRSVVTDGLCSYSAAMKETGAADRHEVGGRLNNRAENSHQPFRRRERAMQRFRSKKTLQKFSSVRAQVQNHFNQERHLITRPVYKQRRSLHWRSGAHLPRRASLASGRVVQYVGESRYFDDAVRRPPSGGQYASPQPRFGIPNSIGSYNIALSASPGGRSVTTAQVGDANSPAGPAHAVRQINSKLLDFNRGDCVQTSRLPTSISGVVAGGFAVIRPVSVARKIRGA